MMKLKSAMLWVLIIFSLIFHTSIRAMDREDRLKDNEVSRLRLTATQVYDTHDPRITTPRLIGCKDLEDAFSPLTRTSLKPTPPRQICAGISCAFGILPAVQIGIPLGMIGLGNLGITHKILPVNSQYSYVVIGVVAIPPLIAATLGTYKGACRFAQYLKPKVITARNLITQRPYTWKEHLLYSYVTPAAQTLLMGGLFFAFIYEKESKLSGWGDPRI